MKVTNVNYGKSPLFEVMTEDGPGDGYNLFVVAQGPNGSVFTHEMRFEYYETERAEAFAKRVEAKGEVDLAYWSEGTPWDCYATPQTYEEERAEALFNEGYY